MAFGLHRQAKTKPRFARVVCSGSVARRECVEEALDHFRVWHWDAWARQPNFKSSGQIVTDCCSCGSPSTGPGGAVLVARWFNQRSNRVPTASYLRYPSWRRDEQVRFRGDHAQRRGGLTIRDHRERPRVLDASLRGRCRESRCARCGHGGGDTRRSDSSPRRPSAHRLQARQAPPPRVTESSASQGSSKPAAPSSHRAVTVRLEGSNVAVLAPPYGWAAGHPLSRTAARVLRPRTGFAQPARRRPQVPQTGHSISAASGMRGIRFGLPGRSRGIGTGTG